MWTSSWVTSPFALLEGWAWRRTTNAGRFCQASQRCLWQSRQKWKRAAQPGGRQNDWVNQQCLIASSDEPSKKWCSSCRCDCNSPSHLRRTLLRRCLTQSNCNGSPQRLSLLANAVGFDHFRPSPENRPDPIRSEKDWGYQSVFLNPFLPLDCSRKEAACNPCSLKQCRHSHNIRCTACSLILWISWFSWNLGDKAGSLLDLFKQVDACLKNAFKMENLVWLMQTGLCSATHFKSSSLVRTNLSIYSGLVVESLASINESTDRK